MLSSPSKFPKKNYKTNFIENKLFASVYYYIYLFLYPSNAQRDWKENGSYKGRKVIWHYLKKKISGKWFSSFFPPFFFYFLLVKYITFTNRKLFCTPPDFLPWFKGEEKWIPSIMWRSRVKSILSLYFLFGR